MTTTHPTPSKEAAMYLTLGSELHGSTVVALTLTAYELANGEFVPFVRVHGLTPATPLVMLGAQVAR